MGKIKTFSFKGIGIFRSWRYFESRSQRIDECRWSLYSFLTFTKYLRSGNELNNGHIQCTCGIQTRIDNSWMLSNADRKRRITSSEPKSQSCQCVIRGIGTNRCTTSQSANAKIMYQVKKFLDDNGSTRYLPFRCGIILHQSTLGRKSLCLQRSQSYPNSYLSLALQLVMFNFDSLHDSFVH